MSQDILTTLADYVDKYEITSPKAYDTATLCLADTIGCGILALKYPDCTKLLGPTVPGTLVPNGSRVPGTDYVLDPIQAAFNIGAMNRWLDYNDTWLAAEWGHPSDNLAGILAISDFLCRNQKIITVKDLLTSLIKAYEIQGCLALKNSFNELGYDHVILVKIATAGVVTKLLGGNRNQIINALSQAFIDSVPLRTYRHAPNTGSRKSWAAGDAASRGVMFALMTMRGEMGYPLALTTKKWGFNDVILKGKSIVLEQPLESYVIENILFKISFPAEFHAQTAVECAIKLHPQIKNRLDEIQSIDLFTQEPAMRIISKSGPLKNPADRDHCIEYMTAVGLIFGELHYDHYLDTTASDPRIENLRKKIHTHENPQYTRDYYDPNKRAIGNSLTIHMNDGSTIGPEEQLYPLGHKKRRDEGLPLLFEKLKNNLSTQFPYDKVHQIVNLFQHPDKLRMLNVNQLIDHLVRESHEQR